MIYAGNIYHAIYYGLNAMGPHNTQLNDKERWLITMYVQELQKSKIKLNQLNMYVVSKNTKIISYILMFIGFIAVVHGFITDAHRVLAKSYG